MNQKMNFVQKVPPKSKKKTSIFCAKFTKNKSPTLGCANWKPNLGTNLHKMGQKITKKLKKKVKKSKTFH
jgi:hypothetical protein